MHIQDFHSKLTSTHDGDPLFAAFRSLSRIEDPRAIFDTGVDPIIFGEWPQWPSMDAHASGAASEGA
jgi:hypothetical protein